MLRRLGVLRGNEDVEYVAEGVRAAGVARLCMDCDDIFELLPRTQQQHAREAGAGWRKERAQELPETTGDGNGDGACVADIKLRSEFSAVG